MFDTAWQDVRYGLRLLRRSPLFTATAALSLAIGIGANTTIFSVATAILLRPLPGLADPARLVDIGRTTNGSGFDTATYPNYKDLRERVTTLSELYAYRGEPQAISLSDGAEAERIYGMPVSGNYFRALGAVPAAGRLFTDDDDRENGAPVVVISYELWQRRFAGAPDTVGRTVSFNAGPVTIIGVTPPGFQGTTILRSDAWVPLNLAALASPRFGRDMFTNRRASWIILGGRLKDGVTIARADAELRSLGQTLEREYPEANRGRGYRVTKSGVVPGRTDAVAGFLGVLLAIVALVLLAACVNIAGMLVARATSRRREIAVRLAIGANRGRLVRQLITETLVLFVAGCALGLVLTQWLTGLLLAVLPTLPVPVGMDFVVDWRVTAFAVTISLVAAVLSGLAPALQASRPELVPALKSEEVTRAGHFRLRSAFIVAQVTVSLVLVIAGGLFVRALGRAASIDPGFDQTNVEVVMLDLSLSGYREPDALAFADRLRDRVSAMPGVRHAAYAADLPLDGGRMGFGTLRVPGLQPPNGEDSFRADWNIVSPGYFAALRMPLVRGRDFTEQDAAAAPGAIIINETMARSVWQTTDVVGRQFDYRGFGPARTITVVGIAPDAQVDTLGERVRPMVYIPLKQNFMSRVSLVVKSDAGGMIPKVRALVRELNPSLPVTSAMPLEEVTALMLIPQRIAGAVAATLGVVVLLLAAIGIYGVTSYSVNRRTREIGIRMALGADRGKVLRLVIQQGALLTGAGIVLGLALGAAGAQLLRSLLFGVSTLDPIAFGGAALLFAIVAIAASYLPARRATEVDPMLALRAE
ncbi:MAG TPA: ABC transporter permease [Vicinamibacterales bacterium]|nr:ABC transporter permease [Vicinamibacterales bacterium]